VGIAVTAVTARRKRRREDILVMNTTENPNKLVVLGENPQPDQPAASQSGAPPVEGIVVTPKAVVKIRAAMAKENISPEDGGLRVGVQGGGCSGLTYNLRFDAHPRERDRVFNFDGVRVFVDPKSFVYLHGMTLDWEETLLHQGFAFKNPNAQKSCGCGTSFT
jgi:iron-sulfur cluster assembly protein